jgi:hypothetical protein
MATKQTKYQKNRNGEFICSHCDYTARHQSTMHYHLAKHEGSLPHVCKYCSQRFLQKGILDLHYTLHHSEKMKPAEKEAKEFRCPVENCAYKNAQKGNCRIHFLRMHMKAESGALREKSNQDGFEAHCKGCTTHFKSNTQFYYPTHTCVVPSKTSALHALWEKLS